MCAEIAKHRVRARGSNCGTVTRRHVGEGSEWEVRGVSDKYGCMLLQMHFRGNSQPLMIRTFPSWYRQGTSLEGKCMACFG